MLVGHNRSLRPLDMTSATWVAAVKFRRNEETSSREHTVKLLEFSLKSLVHRAPQAWVPKKTGVRRLLVCHACEDGFVPRL